MKDALRVSVTAAISLALASSMGSARADVPEQNRVLARSLFEQGRRLMTEKRYDEACAKLAESERLDPAPGTQLNLASCHEALGKTATAWSEFNDALTVARRENRRERVEYAEKEIAKLEPRLSRLTVSVAPNATVPDLEVKLDGVTIGQPAWGVPEPIDPGPHTVSASAPHRLAWTETVAVGDTADAKTVTVPLLAPAPEALQPAPPAPRLAAADDGDHVAPRAPTSREASRTTLGLVFGGAGVVAIAVGGVFGAKALSSWSDRKSECGAAGCTPEGVSSGGAAQTDAWVADFAIGAGVVAAAVGVYFLVSSAGTIAPASTAKKVRLVPTVSARGAGVAVGGAW